MRITNQNILVSSCQVTSNLQPNQPESLPDSFIRDSWDPRTCDVYLNEVAYWSNIPLGVREYTIGGYQVIKKWLSYREDKLLGRPLTKDEVRYVQDMARRIAAILLLEPALDANYQNVKAHAFTWKHSA